jgi:hypothetical protein
MANGTSFPTTTVAVRPLVANASVIEMRETSLFITRQRVMTLTGALVQNPMHTIAQRLLWSVLTIADALCNCPHSGRLDSIADTG